MMSRTVVRFLAVLAIGIVGVIVARNYDAVLGFLQSINLRETFDNECLETNC